MIGFAAFGALPAFASALRAPDWLAAVVVGLQTAGGLSTLPASTLVALGLLGGVVATVAVSEGYRKVTRPLGLTRTQVTELERQVERADVSVGDPSGIVELVERGVNSDGNAASADDAVANRTYEAFIDDLYGELYGESNVDTDAQIVKIRSDFDSLAVDETEAGHGDSLRRLVQEVRKDHELFEPHAPSPRGDAFLTLERYLRGEADDDEMREILHRIADDLEGTGDQADDGAEAVLETLRAHEYPTNTIPQSPEWEKLQAKLADGTPLGDEVAGLASILDKYEQETDALAARQRELAARDDTLGELEDALDEEWIRDRVSDGDRHYLVEAAAQDVIGPRVVHAVASDLDTLDHATGPDLVHTLAEASPETADRVESELADTVDQLREYTTITHRLRGASQHDLDDRLSTLQTKIRSQTPSYQAELFVDWLQQIEDEVDRISPSNRLDLYAMATELDHLEMVVDDTGGDDSVGTLGTVARDVDEKRQSVDEMLRPGNYGVNVGHNITRPFVELADQLRREADQLSETGDAARAKAYLVTARRLLDTVEDVYEDQQLRQYLQHI
jgi:hypothetical protein